MSGDQIAYRDLEPGEVYQEEDQYFDDRSGNWHLIAESQWDKLHIDGRVRRRVQLQPVEPSSAMLHDDEIAYRNLKPGELHQDGDEWLTERGYWIAYADALVGAPHDGDRRSRRPYNITQILQKRAELMRLNEDLNHEAQTLRPLVEGLEQRCEQLEAALEAARKAPDFAEGVAEVLRRLEIAADAIDYLADVGTHDENGYACGLGAAIAVVKKLQEKRP